MVVVSVVLSDIPVIVTVAEPVVAVGLTFNVSVLPVAELLGANDATTPVGKPVAVKLTLLLKPPVGTTAIALVPMLPCAMLNVPGVAVNE
jgi:hypothetical protein